MLYHYVVEGTSVKDSTKVPPDVSDIPFESFCIPYLYWIRVVLTFGHCAIEFRAPYVQSVSK